MQYDMPAMTEEQRQQAIKDFTFRAVNTDCDVSLLAYQIALAVLMAEPVAYTDDEELEDLSKHTFANMFTPRKEYKTDPSWIPLYTAPTASALKLPEYADSVNAHCDTEIAHNVGWNACINAVKQLNGVPK